MEGQSQPEGHSPVPLLQEPTGVRGGGRGGGRRGGGDRDRKSEKERERECS